MRLSFLFSVKWSHAGGVIVALYAPWLHTDGSLDPGRVSA